MEPAAGVTFDAHLRCRSECRPAAIDATPHGILRSGDSGIHTHHLSYIPRITGGMEVRKTENVGQLVPIDISELVVRRDFAGPTGGAADGPLQVETSLEPNGKSGTVCQVPTLVLPAAS